MTYLPLLKRAATQSAILKYSFVAHCEGHKNSAGESAPWCVKSHDTGEIISSYKTKEEADSSLRNMELHKKGSIDAFLEKEIVVWMRMQEGLDKKELLHHAMIKFGHTYNTMEHVYQKAIPSGLSQDELTVLATLDIALQKCKQKAFAFSAINEARDQADSFSTFVSLLSKLL